MKQNEYGLTTDDILNIMALIDYRMETTKRLRETVSDEAIANKFDVPRKVIENLAKNKGRGKLA